MNVPPPLAAVGACGVPVCPPRAHHGAGAVSRAPAVLAARPLPVRLPALPGPCAAALPAGNCHQTAGET